MANATITVLEADGSTQTDVVVLDVGRQAAAASKSVAASTEDKAVLDAIAASLALLDNSISAGNELQVDVVAALPAGTNNIGDVDILSIAAGTNYIGKTRITDGTNDLSLVDAAVSAAAWAIPVAIHPDSVNANGQTTMANSAPVTIASNQTALSVTPTAGELHVGEIGGNTVVKTITMTADTSVMASADIIADTQQLDAAFRKADGTGVLQSLTVFDPDDNTAFAFDVYVHSTSTSMGSENSGITITDGNAAAGIIGVVSFAATDVKDLINGKMYHKSNIGLPVYAVSGTDDLYFSIVNGSGTPTFAGGSIPMRVGILRD